MDTRRLEIFLKLLETKSFSKTAKALGLTQPSVSASLKALEESLGQKLFERTPRSVKPLAAADTLAPYALDIVESVGRAVWALSRQLTLGREKLSIGSSSIPAQAFVPQAVAAFGKLYPKVLIEIIGGQSRQVSWKVADGELDLGLVGAAPQNSDLSSSVLAQDKLVLLATEALAKIIGSDPKSMEDLTKWPLILREEGSGTRSSLLAALGLEEGRDVAKALNIQAVVEGLGPSLALTKTGFGAMVTSALLLPHINLQTLKVINLDFMPGRRFYLISRNSKASPAAEAFIKLIKISNSNSASFSDISKQADYKEF